MENHFIKNITINKFKCFENLEVPNFSQINLIGGKNNIGKTAFMEAIFINTYSKNIKNFIHSLISIKFMRENINILFDEGIYDKKNFMERSNNIDITSNINNTFFKIEEKDGIKNYHFKFNNQNINVNSNDFSLDKEDVINIEFIDSFGFSNSEIKEAHLSVQKKDQEQFLNNVLNKFDNRIDKFITGDIPECKVNGEWIEITELGDGTKHLISIVCALFKSENGYLFIDEIENGIHYTQLDELWEIILTVSKEQNVQIFATTHSKECIESYARVAKKIKNQEIKYIKLSRKSDNSIYAGISDYDMLQYSIDDVHEVR